MPGGGRGGRGGRGGGGGGRGGGHFNNHHSGGTKPAVTSSDGDKNGADGATPPALDAGAVDETENEHNKAAQQANNDAGDTAVASENGEQVLKIFVK